MRLLTMDGRDNAGRPGVLLESGEILDLAAAPSTLSEAHWVPQSVVSILAAGESGLERVAELVDAVELRAGRDHQALLDERVVLPFATTALLAPIRRPGLILIAAPTGGAAYMKSPNTAIGHAAKINVAGGRHDSEVTAEIMLAAVIGRSLYRGVPREAAQAVAAYTVLVDLSRAAPGVDEAMPEWLAARQFPGACPLGPALITANSLDELEAVRLAIAVNGVPASTVSPVPGSASVAEVIAGLSASYGLRAGDLVGIRPRSAGATLTLRPGDRLAVRLDDAMELMVELSPGE
jgi:hypothetical protein